MTDTLMRRIWNSPWTMLASGVLYSDLASHAHPWWGAAFLWIVALVSFSSFFKKGRKRWESK